MDKSITFTSDFRKRRKAGAIKALQEGPKPLSAVDIISIASRIMPQLGLDELIRAQPLIHIAEDHPIDLPPRVRSRVHDVCAILAYTTDGTQWQRSLNRIALA